MRKKETRHYHHNFISAHLQKNDSICKHLRAQLAIASPIILPDGTQFIFLNRLSYFNTLFFIEGVHPTVVQLKVIADYLVVNDHFLCPMLVWATKDAAPTLVRIRPGHVKPVKIVKTSSPYCLAYSICILSGNTDDISFNIENNSLIQK